MPETSRSPNAEAVRDALVGMRRQYRARAVATAFTLAPVSTALAFSVGVFALRTPQTAAVVAATVGVIVLAVAIASEWRRWTLARVAREMEGRVPAFDNLLVTANEALDGRTVHPILREELFAQAANRLSHADVPRSSRGLVAPFVMAALIAIASAAVVWQGLDDGPRTLREGVATVTGGSAAPGALRVTITPPAYVRRPAVTVENPAEVTALEGSALRVEAAGMAPIEFVTRASQVLVVGDRLLQVHVEPDRPPTVTIEKPGQDLLFAAPYGSVPVVIMARDDLRLAGVALRYTRIAGSGETFTFAEGEIPLAETATADGTSRQANASINVSSLKLEDGDTLVYHAIARDDKPGAEPSTSVSFLIEIGKRNEATSAGFALPDDRDRQGLSQQMLIMKTERLHAERATLAPAAALEQSQLLAVEQRMVRAEFLFMTGGEVVDEVEEAESSDDLTQGRLENQGQRELLTAIREMSRAEARLNAADTTQALVFERAALVALQRAFDRRRYFLRTLSERARIDPARRLSGDVGAARPALAEPSRPAADPEAIELRDLMIALAGAIRTNAGLDARLGARVVSVAPRNVVLQRAAQQLASSASAGAKAEAATTAARELAILLRQRLATPAPERLRRDPLLGLLADQLGRTEAPR